MSRTRREGGRRLEIAEDVLRGIKRKAQVGGTPFRAPIGYVNVSKILDGREIRDVALDPVRAPLIQDAFRIYAQTDCRLWDLAAVLDARGMRSRATKNTPEQSLSASRWSSILRNNYYLGIVEVQGTSYPGRHEPLVDEATFTAVQEKLASRRQNAARAWKHEHYLAGTLFCAACGHSTNSLGRSCPAAPARGKGRNTKNSHRLAPIGVPKSKIW